MLLKMLQASVVLEYNGKEWHNVHPFVVSFFEDQEFVQNVEEYSGRIQDSEMDQKEIGSGSVSGSGR